ncbi:MAG TPA: cob(I)yrinic acid a,c-diamide adenosyltransferase [Candidatus Syntrophoarchaeum butanivorans]|uniref:Cob(I)yrinic acid a,c-diamide adenosyltransferase n=1 Tax=Candidatus Syntropharchaeum butanivorans TaxID=1839936 RepID=A0A7C0X2S0_9EURY|nr:cob(I)yrinic acid a,c-diamide adenosyltransferase [Candidatus Syntrophoarchaeum butanivorans]
MDGGGMEERHLKKGYVHVYTGNGKGKTTAALGLAFRAVGHGFKVHIIQFIKAIKKKEYYGELVAAEAHHNLTIAQFGVGFLGTHSADVDKAVANQALRYAKEVIASRKYDLIILDEINIAIHYRLIDMDEVIEMIKNKPEELELVLTGRYAPPEIMDLADYVTEMRLIKHPYLNNVKSRAGIEY